MVGYTISTLFTGEDWNLKNAMIAGGAGGIVGFFAPWAAKIGEGVVATLGLYTIGNIIQYLATQLASGKPITAEGISWAVITGLAAGKLGGVDKTLVSMAKWDPKILVFNSKHAFKTLGELYRITFNNEVARRAWENLLNKGMIRALLASIASNVPDYLSGWYQYLKNLWKQKTGEEWGS